MREADLAHLLLVQACEETDPEGRFLTLEARRRASRSAPAPPPGAGPAEVERYLAERARTLSAGLIAQWPVFGRAVGIAGLPVPVLPVLLLATAAGVVLDRLGETRRIDLLAFPLLGLIAWNLLVYAAGVTAPARRRAGRGDRVAPPLLLRAAVWAVSPDRWWSLGGAVEGSRWVAAALRRFLAHWTASAGHLLRARAARLFHLGAAGFGLGAVLGMYLRGLAVEYRAGWESTFLGAPAVAWLLGTVLGPSAWILHRLAPGLVPPPGDLFSVESIERLRGPAASGDAAVWIHLWAVTTAIVVVVPRLVLAWRADRRARMVRPEVPVDDPYFLRLLAASRGAGVLVSVVPYSFQPSAAAAERMQGLLMDVFGNRARIRFIEPPAYGAPPPDALGADAARPEGPARVVPVFNLAQTPEPEVHGEFLDDVRRLAAAMPDGQLLVLLDEEAYRARLGPGSPRLAERRRAWERLAADRGLSAVAVSTAGGDDDLLARTRAALVPLAPGDGA